MTNRASLTVFVNSTDGYEDCWRPFFTLFKAYWPDCAFPVLLNCETKDFHFPGMEIVVTRIGREDHGRRIPWSDCLLRGLKAVQTEYVLYLQEDYFLNGPVEDETLRRFLSIMDAEGASHLRIMEIGKAEGHEPHRLYPDLWTIPQHANYRIGLQAGLWRRSSLESYLQAGESAWEFERWGTRRAQRVADKFYCQNLELFNDRGRLVFPYVPTGIVKRQWYRPAVEELFAKHGIEVDFSRRGFYSPTRLQRALQAHRSALRRVFMQWMP